MVETRAIMFTVIFSLFLALVITMLGIFGTVLNHLVLLFSAALIMPAMLALLEEQATRQNSIIGVAAVVSALSTVSIIFDSLAIPSVALLFLFFLVFSIIGIELRERLFRRGG
jgi:hypothetical protein